MHQTTKENKVFDINRLPPEPGILFFLVSMSRISTGQRAKQMWEYWRIFSPDKIVKPMVGINTVYTDFLYFNSDEPAKTLKSKFMNTSLAHKNEFLRILRRNPMWIEEFFSFSVWNQMLLEAKDFCNYIGQLKKLYDRDPLFQKYVAQDIAYFTDAVPEKTNIDFILEETLMYYLVAKGKVKLRNDIVRGHEKWILWCYPGKPLKSMLYIQQVNPFRLSNPDNEYEHALYDLEEQKLYDAMKLDIEALDF